MEKCKKEKKEEIVVLDKGVNTNGDDPRMICCAVGPIPIRG